MKSTLKHLKLCWNYIKHISDTYFDACKNIIQVEICCNRLTIIPNMRHISETLRYFSLDDNNISSAQPMYATRFPKLYLLNIAKNKISSFCFPPLDFAPSIRWVFISSNNLSWIHFPQNYRASSKPVVVNLSDNPWNCNGSLGWTQHCTDGSHGTMMCMRGLEVEGMICSTPKEVQGLTPKEAGPRLNIKTVLSMYGDFHVKDKTAVRTSYL